MWKKTVVSRQFLEVLSVIGGLLVLVSIYTSTYVTVLGVLILISGLFSLFYLQHCGSDLELINEKEIKRLFLEEEEEIVLRFYKRSGLPILQGIIHLKVDASIDINENVLEKTEDYQIIEMPFSIKKGRETIISVPFIGKKRGVAKVKNLEIIAYNPIGIGQTYLEYSEFVQKEFVIYPKEQIVSNTNIIRGSLFEGSHAVRQSLFADHLAIVGTRDYVSTDNFSQLHWKASAKRGGLQSKVFQPAAKQAWSVIFNIREPLQNEMYHIGISYLEELISTTAYLLHQADKHHIEYEVFSNVRLKFLSSYYHLEVGEGKTHYIRALDFFARIDLSLMSTTSTKLIKYSLQHMKNTPVILYCGPLHNHDRLLLAAMQRRGCKVFHLNFVEESMQLSMM